MGRCKCNRCTAVVSCVVVIPNDLRATWVSWMQIPTMRVALEDVVDHAKEKRSFKMIKRSQNHSFAALVLFIPVTLCHPSASQIFCQSGQGYQGKGRDICEMHRHLVSPLVFFLSEIYLVPFQGKTFS